MPSFMPSRRLSRSITLRVTCLEERTLHSVAPGQIQVWSGSAAAWIRHIGAVADPSRVLVDAQKQTGAAYHSGPGLGSWPHSLPKVTAFDSGTVHRNLTYSTAGGVAEQLDVYIPRGPAPAGGWPVILAIHGGGWRKYNKQEYGQRIASAFVPNGYVVVAPNYLLSSSGKPSWPLNYEEIQSAVRWVKANASTYGIDPDRIVAMGESAGANLANLLGTESGASAATGPSLGQSASVQAVVSFSGPTDLTALKAQSPQAGRAVVQFLGGQPTAVPQLYAAASPVDHVSPDSAPTLLIHGGNDPLVPVEQSIELADALTNAGVRNQLIVLPGAGHDLNFPINTPRNLVFQILEFLDATWKYRVSQSLIH
jgi:acetyl esterase/lipase